MTYVNGIERTTGTLVMVLDEYSSVGWNHFNNFGILKRFFGEAPKPFSSRQNFFKLKIFVKIAFNRFLHWIRFEQMFLYYFSITRNAIKNLLKMDRVRFPFVQCFLSTQVLCSLLTLKIVIKIDSGFTFLHSSQMFFVRVVTKYSSGLYGTVWGYQYNKWRHVIVGGEKMEKHRSYQLDWKSRSQI